MSFSAAAKSSHHSLIPRPSPFPLFKNHFQSRVCLEAVIDHAEVVKVWEQGYLFSGFPLEPASDEELEGTWE